MEDVFSVLKVDGKCFDYKKKVESNLTTTN